MIEANLAKSAQTLEKAFIAASRELHAALEGRKEEACKKSGTTRKEIQHGWLTTKFLPSIDLGTNKISKSAHFECALSAFTSKTEAIS